MKLLNLTIVCDFVKIKDNKYCSFIHYQFVHYNQIRIYYYQKSSKMSR